jgi:hypothetical protein
MMMDNSLRSVAVFVLVLASASFGACTWVDVLPQAESIKVASEAEVASCTLLGRTRSRTSEKIWIFNRNEDKIEEELVALARNEATRMEGDADTIAAIEPRAGSEQLFGVYHCAGR